MEMNLMLRLMQALKMGAGTHEEIVSAAIKRIQMLDRMTVAGDFVHNERVRIKLHSGVVYGRVIGFHFDSTGKPYYKCFLADEGIVLDGVSRNKMESAELKPAEAA